MSDSSFEAAKRAFYGGTLHLSDYLRLLKRYDSRHPLVSLVYVHKFRAPSHLTDQEQRIGYGLYSLLSEHMHITQGWNCGLDSFTLIAFEGNSLADPSRQFVVMWGWHSLDFYESCQGDSSLDALVAPFEKNLSFLRWFDSPRLTNSGRYTYRLTLGYSQRNQDQVVQGLMKGTFEEEKPEKQGLFTWLLEWLGW